jgi:hypothetical protein
MRLTIVPNDDIVVIDGKGKKFDLSSYAFPAGTRVVQWDDALGFGHIEFDNSAVSIPDDFKANEKITSVEPYLNIIDAYHAKP